MEDTSKVIWTEEASFADNVKPSSEMQSEKRNDDNQTNNGKEKKKNILRNLAPQDLGCLLIILLIVGVVITLVVRDLFSSDFKNGLGNVPSAVTGEISSQTDASVFTLLGTGFDGNIYFFDAPNGIYKKDQSSTDSIPVAKFSAFDVAHWSPSREQIAFILKDRRDALPLLYALDLQSPPSDKELTAISRRDGGQFPATFGLRTTSPVIWSQDENHIAFVAYTDDERAALFVTDVPTGTVRQLTQGFELVLSIAWETFTNTLGVQDERIVYVVKQDGNHTVYSIEKNGAENNLWQR